MTILNNERGTYFAIAKTTASTHTIFAGLLGDSYDVFIRVVDPRVHSCIGFPMTAARRVLRDLKHGKAARAERENSPTEFMRKLTATGQRVEPFGHVSFEWDARGGLRVEVVESSEQSFDTDGNLLGTPLARPAAKINLSQAKAKEFISLFEELLGVFPAKMTAEIERVRKDRDQQEQFDRLVKVKSFWHDHPTTLDEIEALAAEGRYVEACDIFSNRYVAWAKANPPDPAPIPGDPSFDEYRDSQRRLLLDRVLTALRKPLEDKASK